MCRHVWPKLRHLNISDTCLGIADGVSQFCMCCLLCPAFDCNQFGCQRNLRRFNTTDSSLRYIVFPVDNHDKNFKLIQALYQALQISLSLGKCI